MINNHDLFKRMRDGDGHTRSGQAQRGLAQVGKKAQRSEGRNWIRDYYSATGLFFPQFVPHRNAQGKSA